MSDTKDFDMESFLEEGVSNAFSSDGNEISKQGIQTESGTILPFREPGYTGEIDYRIRQLSYSSLLSLHTCPRKFELYKKRTTFRSAEVEQSTITFAFGHVVGQAIQDTLAGFSEKQVALGMMVGWHADFWAEDVKNQKSFFHAYLAAKKFRGLFNSGQFKDYELVYWQGKPAVELSFCITFPDGFRLRGYVDAVLRHKITGEVVVLECKTTNSTNLDDAMYKNSAQAIGYSIVLDVLFPTLSSYKVLYYVYQTKSQEFTAIPFKKDSLQRALWIRELLLDIETIKLYDEAGVYPMRGESCFSFFRQCEYFGTCTLSTDYLTKPATEAEEDKEVYQINLTLMDLLNSQLSKVANDPTERVVVSTEGVQPIDTHESDGML